MCVGVCVWGGGGLEYVNLFNYESKFKTKKNGRGARLSNFNYKESKSKKKKNSFFVFFLGGGGGVGGGGGGG